MAKSNEARVHRSEVKFKGKVFDVVREDVTEPGGVRATRDYVKHPGSVVIMAVARRSRAAEPRVLLVRQYRHVAGQRLWELPAGRIDKGENALAGAKRELLEETGYTARRWKQILNYYASPGFLDETMNVYLAEELTRGKAQPEDDEDIQVRFFPLSQLVKQALNGRLRDGKTLAGVLWLQARG